MIPQTFRSQEVPFNDLHAWEQVSEIFYARITELAKVAFLAISRAYTYEDRTSNPQVEFHYKEALRQARQHRNEFKNKVTELIRALCKVKRHGGVYDASQDLPTQQLRQYLVNQFRMLHNRYIEYADLLLPEEHVEAFLRTLALRAESEEKVLMEGTPPDGVSYYEIDPVLKAEDFEQKFGKQVSIHRRSRKSNAEVYGQAMAYHDTANNQSYKKRAE